MGEKKKDHILFVYGALRQEFHSRRCGAEPTAAQLLAAIPMEGISRGILTAKPPRSSVKKSRQTPVVIPSNRCFSVEGEKPSASSPVENGVKAGGGRIPRG